MLLEGRKNQIAFGVATLLAFLILTGVVYYWQQNKGTGKEDVLSADKNRSAENVKAIENNEELAETVGFDEKKSDEVPDENFRQKSVAYFIANINTLVPPPENDKWDTPSISFYFIGNSHFYVDLFPAEAEIGAIRILYKSELNEKEEISLQELAKYKEGEEEWSLLSGKDDFEEYYFDEYGFDEETNKWAKLDFDEEIINFEEGDEELTEEEEADIEEEDSLLDPEEAVEDSEAEEAEKTIIP